LDQSEVARLWIKAKSPDFGSKRRWPQFPNSGEFGYGEFGYGEFGYGEFGYGEFGYGEFGDGSRLSDKA
jgi:hypothetical protein